MLDDQAQPFWKTKTLEEMTREEWESLCDGCGRCCLVKLEDEDTAEVYLTRLACGLLDVRTCRCKDYANRFQKMPDCLEIDVKKARELKWLPTTCAYRMVDEGRDLAWWHPLVSGTRRDGASGRHFGARPRHERAARQGRELHELHHSGFGGVKGGVWGSKRGGDVIANS